MIILKSKAELEVMREAGRIVALTHQELAKAIKPGVTTKQLDELAETFIRSKGAIPSFKGYGGFPGSICASVNEELVHGIPGKRVLQEGDIISIDIGAQYQGFHGDSAWTYPVGNIAEEDQRLLRVTEESLYKGLEKALPGARLSDISHAIQIHAEAAGFTLVREYVGHGIGQNLHEDPQVPNYGPPDRGPRLKPGMVLAIEPMVNAGERYVRTLEDNWTVVTVDRKRCAHFEHTIAITEDGYEIFTRA
ncbi:MULTISPECIES: type I methionyl aminopeptidase [Brevibacillus]|jgi:methionyl aminopeptidase|uniref:Methionine aminopeptidase n=1 Tax=Brevibacillus borstelensis AK1 TaxID=1300222 RepID=M8DAG9_9BACL|nr:type I methionyl aminopeptidase [Brevibacillus borstelensis]EMT50312.1 methionine aminopeptidase [Brevibacillus borstelensis AK1]KKX54569.1 methionine aminopeptidase [Brevibacillus borstelensis cifa_chp40]MBE5395100.1 type I methionyl aminopeptidase [Brevibacillus borstelensis]MCC0565387.1 type I methionyl aminopeptidase [Brevibacillus borstelensis]MCM3473027.1 type I methionyl aminopeptidase [Brevibacillus borstelensis]